MATNISCPNCHEGFGKDTENPKEMYCDNCTHEWINEYGYDGNEEKEEEEDEM